MNLGAWHVAAGQAQRWVGTSAAAMVVGWPVKYLHVIVPTVLAVAFGMHFIHSAYGTQDDDGYIFYQYARNLATGYGLSFNPGEVSFGVTSGGWVLLLTCVHVLLRSDIIMEAQYLGLGLYALSVGVWAQATARWSGYAGVGLLAATLYTLELDAMKYSLHGLETGLSLALFAIVAYLLVDGWLERPMAMGIAVGLVTLTRPDNAVVLLPVLLAGLSSRRPSQHSGKRMCSRRNEPRASGQVGTVLEGGTPPAAPQLQKVTRRLCGLVAVASPAIMRSPFGNVETGASVARR